MSRFWCKLCEIFVDDNNISKRSHNQSQRHLKSIEESIQKLHQRNIDEAKENGINLNYIKKTSKAKKEDETPTLEVQVGDWETVEPRKDEKDTVVDVVKPVVKTIGSDNLKKHDIETKKWNVTKKKTIQEDLSDSDEETTEKIAVRFKKRKILKK